jgi:NAD(P)-dependent dehydrogenase (short-subunit alcohol dehydrogenase family)
MRILITGAGRAIGVATATQLTRAGHEVLATARDISLLDDLDVALRLPLDVTDDASVAAALELAGPLDALVNNAAQNGKGPLERYPLDRIESIFATNVLGPLRVLQPLLPAWRIRGSGVIVNVSSIQGRVATPLDGAYSASKYALESLSETLHYELAHFGIRVVIVEPGYTAPGMKSGERVHGDSVYDQLWEQMGAHRPGGDRPRRPSRPQVGGRGHPRCHRGPGHPAAGTGGRGRGHGAQRPVVARGRRLRGHHARGPGGHLVALPAATGRRVRRQWAFWRLRAAIDR